MKQRVKIKLINKEEIEIITTSSKEEIIHNFTTLKWCSVNNHFINMDNVLFFEIVEG